MVRLFNLGLSLVMLALSGQVLAALPTTDIAIIDLNNLKLDKPKKIFHLTYRQGYDNQPKFSKDGKTIYFTRSLTVASKGVVEEVVEQMDIMAYSFENKTLKNISRSENTSEYSATPFTDNWLSIIGVNQQGKQYLNKLHLETAEQNTFSTSMEPIGYHAWLTAEQAAVFVLGETMTLQVLATTANSKPVVLAENIGRCIQRLTESSVSFTVEKDGLHHVKLIDGEHKIHKTGLILPKGVQDYVWLDKAEKTVLYGKDSKLYRLTSKGSKAVMDLAEFGIDGISRLAFDKNSGRLAVVYNR